MPAAHQGGPRAEQGALIQESSLGDLRQGVHSILGVHMAQQHAQAVRALQLLDAPVDVLRLQQVVPVYAEMRDSAPLLMKQKRAQLSSETLWSKGNAGFL